MYFNKKCEKVLPSGTLEISHIERMFSNNDRLKMKMPDFWSASFHLVCAMVAKIFQLLKTLAAVYYPLSVFSMASQVLAKALIVLKGLELTL